MGTFKSRHMVTVRHSKMFVCVMSFLIISTTVFRLSNLSSASQVSIPNSGYFLIRLHIRYFLGIPNKYSHTILATLFWVRLCHNKVQSVMRSEQVVNFWGSQWFVSATMNKHIWPQTRSEYLEWTGHSRIMTTKAGQITIYLLYL